MADALAPLAPFDPRRFFGPLGEDLISLLESLEADEWSAPTVCSEWSVRDVAAHLLDSAMRRVAVERDGFLQPPGEGEVTDYRSLVAFLDRLNAEWVVAARRLSPRQLVDLMAGVEAELLSVFATLDLQGPARFPVSWAGEEESACWFDLARELTERWLHQQQIRLAVGRPALAEPALSKAVFDTFARALPHRYRGLVVDDAATVALEITGQEVLGYALDAPGGEWRIRAGWPEAPLASARMDEETAWLMFSKGATPKEVIERSERRGSPEALGPLFETVAVMA